MDGSFTEFLEEIKELTMDNMFNNECEEIASEVSEKLSYLKAHSKPPIHIALLY